MYMPGRLRTASSPSSTVIDAAPYSAGALPCLFAVSSFSIAAGSPTGLSTRGLFCSGKVPDLCPVTPGNPGGNCPADPADSRVNQGPHFELFQGSDGTGRGFALRPGHGVWRYGNAGNVAPPFGSGA